MTLGTRPGRYSKRQDVTRDVTRCCKMLQDVKKACETQDLSKVGHLPAMCHQIWKKVLGMPGPHDRPVQHFLSPDTEEEQFSAGKKACSTL